MGSHPAQLAIRFLLELAALGSVGVFSWTRFEGYVRWVAVLALPLVFMALWGIFAVPDDPSRSGSAPIPTPGVVRLVLELAIFGTAFALLWVAGLPRLASGLAVVTIAHYALSWDRMAWLLHH